MRLRGRANPSTSTTPHRYNCVLVICYYCYVYIILNQYWESIRNTNITLLILLPFFPILPIMKTNWTSISGCALDKVLDRKNVKHVHTLLWQSSPLLTALLLEGMNLPMEIIIWANSMTWIVRSCKYSNRWLEDLYLNPTIHRDGEKKYKNLILV